MTYSYMGIDGCKAGWFCVMMNDKLGWDFRLLPDITAVHDLARQAKAILIDMPIGFPDKGGDGRECDRLARKCLAPRRHCSVFSAPARPTLAAADYDEALRINRRVTGKGLSKQSWLIAPRMREVDQALQKDASLRRLLRECHPEVCFWALNGEQAMQFRKKDPEGQAERLGVLERFFPAVHVLFQQAQQQYSRKQLARDDILDALVNAVTAWHGYPHYGTLPERPPKDGTGLPMEMVYAGAN